MSYQETHCGRSYPSAEAQLVYSTAPTDWASVKLDTLYFLRIIVSLLVSFSRDFKQVVFYWSLRDIHDVFNKFPDVFCLGTFIDSAHIKL